MISTLSVAAYFASMFLTVREATRTPVRSGLCGVYAVAMIALALITGTVITGGE